MSMVEKIFSTQDIKIHYCIQKGNGEPLIFLHGGGGSLSAWNILLPYFKDDTGTLIAVDLRGHGLSGKPKEVNDYSLENHSEDILNILKQENVEKGVIVGHCLGSMVAATFAAIYPQKVRKLILINTNYELPWFISRTPFKQILYLIFDVGRYLIPFIATSKERVDYSRFLGSFDIDLLRLREDIEVMGVYSVIRQTMALLFWNGKKYFSKIKVSTLVIAGTNDLFYPKGTGENLMKLNSRIRLEYVDSNHISIINSPREIYQNISTFLHPD